MRLVLLPLAAFALGIATAAAAQDLMGGGIVQSWTSSQLLLNAERRAWAAPVCTDEARGVVDCDAARDRPPALDPARLRFRVSPEVRRRGYASFVAKSRAADPAGAAELERILANDPIPAIGAQIAAIGLRTDNVADAMAVYVMEAWEVVSGQLLAPSRARAQAVRRQMTHAIGFTPAFVDASDAEKQVLAEAMLVQAALIANAAIGARQNGPEQLALVRAAVTKGARATLGFDLAGMTLTDRGLEERR